MRFDGIDGATLLELAICHELIHGGAADAEKGCGFLDGEQQSLVAVGRFGRVVDRRHGCLALVDGVSCSVCELASGSEPVSCRSIDFFVDGPVPGWWASW